MSTISPANFRGWTSAARGLSYRHGYFAANSALGLGNMSFDSIAHIDWATGKKQLYTFPKGDNPGEPVFVPRGMDEGATAGW